MIQTGIQSKLTYSTKWKTIILCMCYGLGVCDAAVDLTWVPCLYLKSIVARGLSISRILSKWPPIGVMQQSHAMRWWDLSFNLSSYGAVLMGKFGRVPYTLHTAHTWEYGLTSLFAHRWATFLVRRAYTRSSLDRTPVITSNRQGSAMQNITIVVLPLDVRVRTLVMEYGYLPRCMSTHNAWGPQYLYYIINEYNPTIIFHA